MRRKVKNRIRPEPDDRYGSLMIASFIGKIMKNGKRSIAEKIIYGALDELEQQIKKPGLEVLNSALDNAGPQLELKSRRIGGANYQVPYEVKGDRKNALALRWIIDAARKTKGKPMQEKLMNEILNAYNNTGTAIKKKLDMHKMAEANKAFAHFAW